MSSSLRAVTRWSSGGSFLPIDLKVRRGGGMWWPSTQGKQATGRLHARMLARVWPARAHAPASALHSHAAHPSDQPMRGGRMGAGALQGESVQHWNVLVVLARSHARHTAIMPWLLWMPGAQDARQG